MEMNKKILNLLLCGLLLIGLTGCGNNTATEENKLSSNGNSSNSTEEIKESKISNSTIEETIDSYIKALHENYDSKEAFKYLDLVGIATWQYLDLPQGYSINETQAQEFIDKYNEFSNDSTITNKIENYAKELFTDNLYRVVNDEANNNTTKYRNQYEIKSTTELADNIYLVKTCLYYKANGTNTSIDSVHILLKESDGYYFVDSNALYIPSKINLAKVLMED